MELSYSFDANEEMCQDLVEKGFMYLKLSDFGIDEISDGEIIELSLIDFRGRGLKVLDLEEFKTQLCFRKEEQFKLLAKVEEQEQLGESLIAKFKTIQVLNSI